MKQLSEEHRRYCTCGSKTEGVHNSRCAMFLNRHRNANSADDTSKEVK